MAESPEQVPSEDGNSFLEDELEALRSIYINETNVYEDNEATVVSIDLHPATADNLQEQYVKLTLKLTVKDGYPDVIPEIDIRNPRGLSDEILSSITNDLVKIAEDKKGKAMLFEIIEAAKDYLTAGNRPCEECAICLYGFHDDDIFTKTECYHYFHSHCLARYAKTSSKSEDDLKSDDSLKNELLCPVCRLPIHFDGVEDSYPSPVKCDDEFSITDTILQTQKKLQELYIKQVEKGGIIDLEAEKNKYLIEISHVPSILDAASESKSEEEMSFTMPNEKDKTQTTSPSDDAQNEKLDSQKHSSMRSSYSERSNRKFTKYDEDRRRNEVSRPYQGNDYRNERYQSNRGGYGYRRDPRSRNNYDRRYDGYNNEKGDRYASGINRNRYSNPRRNNWHENQFKSNRYERHDKFEDRSNQQYEKHNKYEDRNTQHYEGHDRNSQKYERYDKYDDRNSQKYERYDRYDDRKMQKYEKNDDRNSQRYDNPRGQRKQQPDSEEGVACKDDENDDRNSQKYERHDKHDDRSSQKYERHDRYIDRNMHKYEKHDKNDDRSSQRYDNPRGQRKQQPDSEEGVSCKDDVNEDRSCDIDQQSGNDDDDNVQDGQIDKVDDEKRSNTYSSDRRNVHHSGGQRNNQYDGRENRYDRRNVRYDNNKRYGRFEDNRNGQFDRRNGRFDSRKYNEHNGPRRNENFASGRSDRAHEVNRNRYLNPENEAKEQKFRKEIDEDAKNTSENSSVLHEIVSDGNPNESDHHTELNASSNISSKDEVVSEDAERASGFQTKSSSYSSDRRHNFPNRNSGAHKQNDGRNYSKHYQRSNSNGDRYSKQPNYHSDRRQAKPQNFGRTSDNKDDGENSNPINSNEAAAEGAGEPNESNLEEHQACNTGESGDFSDSQHSKKSSMRTESGNMNHYKNYRDGKQGYNNRYQNNNKNYHETRPYRNNPRSRNNQCDYSDRTSNGSKRYTPQKYANDSSHNSLQTENDSDVKPESISKESVVESVPVESSKPTEPPKSTDLEKSVPTSNFLPPMSSVAPPPGFQNPTRKIVYGLAAANPPPGFNRS